MSTQRSPRRRIQRGFTLIEFLVVIAIMAVMAAMTIPAIQAARRSAQAIRCRHNLAQLGAAFHAYHLTQGALPPGSVDLRSPALPQADRFVWGWALQLLPYLGESSRFAQLDPRDGIYSAGNASALSVCPAEFSCPTSSSRAQSGYAGCFHHHPADITANDSGVLTLNTRVRYADLPDGLHNSILLGEALEVRWGEGVFGSLRSITETWGPPGISTTHPRSTQARLKVVRKQIQRQKAKLEQAALEKAAQMQSDSRPALPGQETPRGADEPSPGEDTPAEEDLPESDSSEVRNAESGLITFSGVIHSDIDEIPNSMAAASDRPPSPPHPIQLPPSQAFGFWPTHLDGGHFLMVDGSVRLISRHVETEVLRRLANRLDTQDPGAF